MKIHKIEKQKLLLVPFTPDARKLARALYNTAKKSQSGLHVEVKLKTIFSLLGISDSKESLAYIVTLLEELNEPIAVKDFKFFAKIYPLRIMVFCRYTFVDESVAIELNEEYLLAEKSYMIDPFLSH